MSEVALISRKSTRIESDGVLGAAGKACVKQVFQEGRESVMVEGPPTGMCPANRFDDQAVLSSNRLSAGVAAREREVGAQCRSLPSSQEASHGKGDEADNDSRSWVGQRSRSRCSGTRCARHDQQRSDSRESHRGIARGSREDRVYRWWAEGAERSVSGWPDE